MDVDMSLIHESEVSGEVKSSYRQKETGASVW
jgi:hypothetical protein